MVMVLGMSWGVGMFVIIFYNGVIFGVVVVDYVLVGEMVFFFGWLFLYGVIEILVILVGG